MKLGKFSVQWLIFTLVWAMVWIQIFFSAGCGGGVGNTDFMGSPNNSNYGGITSNSTEDEIINTKPTKSVNIDLKVVYNMDSNTRELSRATVVTKDGSTMTDGQLASYLSKYDLSGVVNLNLDFMINGSASVKDILNSNLDSIPIAELKIHATENSWIWLGGNINEYFFGKEVFISNKISPEKSSQKIYIGYSKGASDLNVYYEDTQNYFLKYSFSELVQVNTRQTPQVKSDDACDAPIALAAIFAVVAVLVPVVQVKAISAIIGLVFVIIAILSGCFKLDPSNGSYNPPAYCPPPRITISRIQTSSPSYIPPGNTITSPPSLESGVEDLARKTNCPWEFTEWKCQLISVYRNSDGKICMMKRQDDGRWVSWIVLPDCWTAKTPSITTWLNHIVVAFTDGVGKIWVGILWNGEDFSGWKFTGRTSRFAPVIRSDGKNLMLVHIGLGNYRIYWSIAGPWFQDPSGWIDTGRDSRNRPDAVMANGNGYIIHRGGNNNAGYWKNVTLDPSVYDWIEVPGRGSCDSYGIFVYNGTIVVSHKGANDSRIYVSVYDSGNWPGYKEYTICAPYINMFKSRLGCAFVNNGYMRFQWIDNIFPKPVLEPGVEEIVRSSRVSWLFVDYLGELISVHVGKSDGKIYIMRKTDGNWWVWKIIPDAYTEDPVSVVRYQNHLVFAFRGYDGKIWVGMLEDGYIWTGWHDTGRTSTHAPTLASNGTVAYFIHKGQNNDTIYVSGQGPYFTQGYFETYRTTKLRPAAFVDALSNLWIAHIGSSNTTIYYKNWTSDPSPNNWKELERNSFSDPTILVIDRKVYFGHQGAGDARNYLGLPGGPWLTLKEKTIAAPFIGYFNGKIIYAYNNSGELRIQYVDKF